MPLLPFPIAGVDEVGRGPLAGPVTAAAVVLDPRRPVDGLADSKALGEADRARLDAAIRRRALGVGLGEASVEEIDAMNVLHASHLAMRRALGALGRALRAAGHPAPGLVVVDGDRVPGPPEGDDAGAEARAAQVAVVGGDGRVAAVGAASIVAKVARDALMVELDARHPGFGLAGHKGYPTAAHREALVRLGPSAVHRRSFAPVRRALEARVGGARPHEGPAPDRASTGRPRAGRPA